MWLAGGLGLVVLELVTPSGFFILFFGLSALTVGVLARLDVAHRKVLVLTDGVKPNVFLSGRNLPNVHVMPYSDVSTYHILWSHTVLVESAALGEALAPIAEKEVAKVRVRKAAPKAETKAAPAAKAPAKKKAAAPKAEKAEKAPAAKKKAAAPKAEKAAAPKKTAAKPAAKKKGK